MSRRKEPPVNKVQLIVIGKEMFNVLVGGRPTTDHSTTVSFLSELDAVFLADFIVMTRHITHKCRFEVDVAGLFTRSPASAGNSQPSVGS